MKKRNLLSLILAMATICSCASCANNTTDSSVSEQSNSTSLHQNAEANEFQYNGTFNAEVFEHICRNIVIEDKTLSLPFTIQDMGEKVSYNNIYTYYDEKYELASAPWTYNGNIIGFFTAVCQANDNEWSDNLICSFDVQQDEYEQQSELKYISIGGFELMDTKEKVIDALGQPTEKKEFSSGTIMYSYLISNDDNIKFDIDPKGKITIISITISNDFK
ncbi:MAG: hypothetical protein IJZ51_11070 [Ruminiclostridium sp.]|nr:hypothetical protein [Ruminiclostridium sp.]